MATTAPDHDSSEPSSSTSGLPDNDLPPTRRDMATMGVPSDHASTAPTAAKLRAVTAPGREDLVVLVSTSALRMPVIERPASDLNLVPSPENRFLNRDEATPPGRTSLHPAVGVVGGLDFPARSVMLAASRALAC
ncbi:hypothetical protein MTO96_004194 [Rhipicephalus appendiculatus]